MKDGLMSKAQKVLSGSSVVTLKRLGIIDQNKKPVPEMIMACKALRINLSDLEPKTFDEFLRKQHDAHYKIGGQKAIE